MLNCQHHVSWIRAVEGGLHQCILCHQVVREKDVYPRLDDLPEAFRRRWREHEAAAGAGAPGDAATGRPPPTVAEIRAALAASGRSVA